MIGFIKKASVACAVFCLGNASWAGTIVIDFDDLVNVNGGQVIAPVVEDGFVIDPALSTSVPQIANFTGVGGSPALGLCGFCWDVTEGISIYSQTGLTFELDSLDVFTATGIVTADYPGAGLVTGYLQGGGTVSQAISANFAGETILFDSTWSDLTSIDITFATSSFYPFGSVPVIDNITLQAVPVPAAVWLFASGLGVLGWLRRRAR